MKQTLLIATLVFACSTILGEENIESLHWMTGKWVGQMGPMEIEEIWNEPKAGSIQALVRLRNGAQMLMVEMIVIEEHEGSLRLRIQQWDPGMEPRETGRQSMKLVESKDREVSFQAIDEGPIRKLTYSRLSDTEFQITVVQGENPPQRLLLRSISDSD